MTFAALTFLFRGKICLIFPTICANPFGVKNAAGNAGTMYTAKGTASLLVPLASLLAKGGNWDRVFMVGAAITVTAGLAAGFVLTPMRRRLIEYCNAIVEKQERMNVKKYA